MSLPKLTPDMLDDVDVLELLCEVDGGNISKVPALFKAIYGEEGYRAIRTELAVDGKTKASAMVEWFKSQAEVKN